MMKNCALLVLAFAMLAFCPLGRAQDQEPDIDSTIAMARANMQADRTALITTGMNFSDKESAAFWPIYQQYEYERSKQDDRRAVVIKQYTQKYPNLTDAEAKSMAEEMFDCESRLAELKKKYLQEVQQGASGPYGSEVFSIGSSRRPADGYECGILASSADAGTIHRAGKQGGRSTCAMRHAALRPRFSSREHSMFSIMKRPVIVGAMLMSVVMALAQTQVQRETLSVQGYPEQATVIRNHGHCVRGCRGSGANHKRLSQF